MTESGPADRRSAPPPEVFLHIGTMKTGTSYLQRVLARNADGLAQVGVRYANAGPGSGRAVHEAIGQDGADSALDGRWAMLVDEMTGWPGRAVVLSSELLSFVPGTTAAKIVASFAPAPVTVIVTARDLVRLLPSAWQNKVKHGRAWAFPSFVQSVMSPSDDPGGPARSFWHHHDLATIVRRWVAAAGADRVVVVPVPPSGAAPEVLWQRFASVLRVDPQAFDAAQDRRSNLSMGFVETELLRRVNRELRELVDKDTHRQLVLKYLANEVLRPDPNEAADRAAVVLGPEAHAWAVQRSRELADDVVALGVRIVGDTEDLVPPPLPIEPAGATGQSGLPVVSSGTVRAVVALLVRVAELEGGATVDRSAAADGGSSGVGVGRRNSPTADKRRQRRRNRRAQAGSTELPTGPRMEP